jgi:hypothetical protein
MRSSRSWSWEQSPKVTSFSPTLKWQMDNSFNVFILLLNGKVLIRNSTKSKDYHDINLTIEDRYVACMISCITQEV